MNIVVLYHSTYGNTQKIAEAIADGFQSDDVVKLLPVGGATPTDVSSTDLLITGSPTREGKETIAIQAFFDGLGPGVLERVRVAAFDTRFPSGEANVYLGAHKGIMDYAAPKILHIMTTKGGQSIVPPEGFIVTDKEGPLKSGELERAVSWADFVRGEAVQKKA